MKLVNKPGMPWTTKGAFTIYVYNARWVGGQKSGKFVNVYSIKVVNEGRLIAKNVWKIVNVNCERPLNILWNNLMIIFLWRNNVILRCKFVIVCHCYLFNFRQLFHQTQNLASSSNVYVAGRWSMNSGFWLLDIVWLGILLVYQATEFLRLERVCQLFIWK